LTNFFTSDLFILIVVLVFLGLITVKVVYDKMTKPGCASCKIVDFDREMEKIREQIRLSKIEEQKKDAE